MQNALTINALGFGHPLESLLWSAFAKKLLEGVITEERESTSHVADNKCHDAQVVIIKKCCLSVLFILELSCPECWLLQYGGRVAQHAPAVFLHFTYCWKNTSSPLPGLILKLELLQWFWVTGLLDNTQWTCVSIWSLVNSNKQIPGAKPASLSTWKKTPSLFLHSLLAATKRLQQAR